MLKKIIIHPFLFALYPVLFLYEHNKDLVPASYVFRPMAISLVLAISIFMVIKIFIRDNQKVSLVTSLFLLLFFSFGHIALNHKYVHLFLWSIVFLSLCISILATHKSLDNFCDFLNIVSISLLIIPLIKLGVFYKNTKTIDQEERHAESVGETGDNLTYNPDIYYIILDGYARSDVLDELYGYNNNHFIDWLIDKGFYVAKQSTSNYPQTYLSMSSSLNFKYLDGASNVMGIDSNDRSPLGTMIRDNEVYKILKENNYKIVALPPMWSGMGNTVFDLAVGLNNKIDSNDFEDIFANTTLLSLFWEKKIRVNNLRKRILFNFDHLPEIAKLNDQTFTYVHFLSPHPPFIFNEDGEWVEPEGRATGLDGDHYFNNNPGKKKYREKYVKQIEFLNQQVIKMVELILDKSNHPPIIILQSDHGPGSNVYWEEPILTNMKERMSILNAYYVPEKTRKYLYASITPVNTFRVIFNSIIGSNYKILADRSYFSTWSHPYKFIDVTETVKRPISSAYLGKSVQEE